MEGRKLLKYFYYYPLFLLVKSQQKLQQTELADKVNVMKFQNKCSYRIQKLKWVEICAKNTKGQVK